MKYLHLVLFFLCIGNKSFASSFKCINTDVWDSEIRYEKFFVDIDSDHVNIKYNMEDINPMLYTLGGYYCPNYKECYLETSIPREYCDYSSGKKVLSCKNKNDIDIFFKSKGRRDQVFTIKSLSLEVSNEITRYIGHEDLLTEKYYKVKPVKLQFENQSGKRYNLNYTFSMSHCR